MNPLRRFYAPIDIQLVPIVEPAEGLVYCAVCTIDTGRESLPAIPASKVYGAIPELWFCRRCGVVDWGYTDEAEAS